MLKAVELAHPVAEAQLPGWRQPTLPRPPTLKAVKLAFPLAPPHASRMRLRLQSRQLGSSPLSTFAAQGTSALLPRAGETVAAGTVHRLARATHQWPARGAHLFQTGAMLPHF